MNHLYSCLRLCHPAIWRDTSSSSSTLSSSSSVYYDLNMHSLSQISLAEQLQGRYIKNNKVSWKKLVDEHSEHFQCECQCTPRCVFSSGAVKDVMRKRKKPTVSHSYSIPHSSDSCNEIPPISTDYAAGLPLNVSSDIQNLPHSMSVSVASPVHSPPGLVNQGTPTPISASLASSVLENTSSASSSPAQSMGFRSPNFSYSSNGPNLSAVTHCERHPVSVSLGDRFDSNSLSTNSFDTQYNSSSFMSSSLIMNATNTITRSSSQDLSSLMQASSSDSTLLIDQSLASAETFQSRHDHICICGQPGTFEVPQDSALCSDMNHELKWVCTSCLEVVNNRPACPFCLYNFPQCNQSNPSVSFTLPLQVVPTETRIFVADSDNHRIHVLDTSLHSLDRFGRCGVESDAFVSPYDLHISHGLLFVADTYNHRIKIHELAGKFIGSFGTAGRNSGEFTGPQGLTVSKQGIIYVADYHNERIQIFQLCIISLRPLQAAALFLKEWKGGPKTPFSRPCHVTLFPNEKWLFVVDPDRESISYFDTLGKYMGRWPSESNPQHRSLFKKPISIAFSSDTTTAFVIDLDANALLMLNISDFNNITLIRSFTDGLSSPQSVALFRTVDSKMERAVVTDCSNHRLQMYYHKGGEWQQTNSGVRGNGPKEFYFLVGIAVYEPEKM